MLQPFLYLLNVSFYGFYITNNKAIKKYALKRIYLAYSDYKKYFLVYKKFHDIQKLHF